jgi:hypothetical protein
MGFLAGGHTMARSASMTVVGKKVKNPTWTSGAAGPTLPPAAMVSVK